MTGPLFPPRRPARSFALARIWRDLLSLLLIVVGAIGFLATAFAIDALVGLLVVFAVTVAAGVALGMSKGG